MAAQLIVVEAAVVESAESHWVLRCTVVLIAAAVLFVRVPSYFTYPQFWAEDALIWAHAHKSGASALWLPMAGYLFLVPKLVGLIASAFPDAAAPAIYVYAALAIDLAMVWLATSPRLDMPFKPIIALAIVAPMHGIFALGTLANVQWLLPFGAFCLMFMRRAGLVALAAEAGFLALFSLTGPICLIAAPLFLLRLTTVRDRRMIILAAIVTAGAAIQAAIVMLHLREAMITGPQAPWTPWALIASPANQMLAPIGALIQPTRFGAMMSAVVSIGIAALALRPPFGAQKLFMLMLAGGVAALAMVKSGPSFLESYNLRYFYLASVMLIWFLCCVAAAPRFGIAGLAAACALGFAGVSSSIRSESVTADLHWAHWSRFVDSGLPLSFASSPPGWYLEIPASRQGPLSTYSKWIGKRLDELPGPGECDPATLSVVPLNSTRYTNVTDIDYYDGDLPRWTVTVKAAGSFDVLAVIVADRVQAFALPSWEKDTWVGAIPAGFGEPITIAGLQDGARSCPLGQITTPMQ